MKKGERAIMKYKKKRCQMPAINIFTCFLNYDGKQFCQKWHIIRNTLLNISYANYVCNPEIINRLVNDTFLIIQNLN